MLNREVLPSQEPRALAVFGLSARTLVSGPHHSTEKFSGEELELELVLFQMAQRSQIGRQPASSFGEVDTTASML